MTGRQFELAVGQVVQVVGVPVGPDHVVGVVAERAQCQAVQVAVEAAVLVQHGQPNGVAVVGGSESTEAETFEL